MALNNICLYCNDGKEEVDIPQVIPHIPQVGSRQNKAIDTLIEKSSKLGMDDLVKRITEKTAYFNAFIMSVEHKQCFLQ